MLAQPRARHQLGLLQVGTLSPLTQALCTLQRDILAMGHREQEGIVGKYPIFLPRRHLMHTFVSLFMPSFQFHGERM